jgi:hypothetical protein
MGKLEGELRGLKEVRGKYDKLLMEVDKIGEII